MTYILIRIGAVVLVLGSVLIFGSILIWLFPSIYRRWHDMNDDY